MKPRSILIAGLLIISLCLQVAVAYDLPPGVVSWSPDRPLSWTDFRGAPPSNVSDLTDAAAIHMSICWPYTYTYQTGAADELVTFGSVCVINFMDPSRSWAYGPRMKPDTLRHEQTHFNLNEVYRRKVETALSRLQPIPPMTRTALRQFLSRVADPILDRMVDAQSQYDRETDHGNNAAAQAEWDRKVLGWLQQPSLAP
jgi:hypothetical protein